SVAEIEEARNQSFLLGTELSLEKGQRDCEGARDDCAGLIPGEDRLGHIRGGKGKPCLAQPRPESIHPMPCLEVPRRHMDCQRHETQSPDQALVFPRLLPHLLPELLGKLSQCGRLVEGTDRHLNPAERRSEGLITAGEEYRTTRELADELGSGLRQGR